MYTAYSINHISFHPDFLDKYVTIAALLFCTITVIACRGETDSHTQAEGVFGDLVSEVDSTKPLYQVVIEHEMTINQLDEPHIQNLWTIITDDDGNIYWQDNRIAKLHQYSPTGDYMHSFGGKGRGPGEFEYLESSSISDDAIIMLDFFSQIVHVFNRHTGDLIQSGTLERENAMDALSPIHQVLAVTDTTFIGIPEFNRHADQDSLSLIQHAISGKILANRLITYPPGDALESRSGGVSRRTPTLFTAKSEVALLPDGGFVHSYAAEPIFHIYDEIGVIQRSISLNIEPVEITRNHLDRAIENSHSMIDLASAVRNADWIPEFWPYWNNFHVDGHGNLWIEMNINPPDDREWWVVSQDGELLAKAQFSDNGTLRHIGKDDLYRTYYEDGVHELRRYRMRLE